MRYPLLPSCLNISWGDDADTFLCAPAAIGGEQVDPDSRGDLHESFDIGPDSQAFSGEAAEAVNQYPPQEDLPEFKKV